MAPNNGTLRRTRDVWLAATLMGFDSRWRCKFVGELCSHMFPSTPGRPLYHSSLTRLKSETVRRSTDRPPILPIAFLPAWLCPLSSKLIRVDHQQLHQFMVNEHFRCRYGIRSRNATGHFQSRRPDGWNQSLRTLSVPTNEPIRIQCVRCRCAFCFRCSR